MCANCIHVMVRGRHDKDKNIVHIDNTAAKRRTQCLVYMYICLKAKYEKQK
jgi:hypothetical protein